MRTFFSRRPCGAGLPPVCFAARTVLEQLEQRRLLAVGPDGFGYAADGVPFNAVDLIPGASGVTSILTNVDDSSANVSLNGSTIGFYGQSYSSLSVSSNGLITFGGSNTSFTNGDLTDTPSQATVAPLWDDWVTNDTTSDQVLYAFRDTDGQPGDDELIVEWNQVNAYSSSGPTNVTFQAVFELNPASGVSRITFNYLDLGVGGANSATVGIKGAGTQSTSPDADRLLISQNQPSPLVGTGKSILVTRDPTLGGLAGQVFQDVNGNGVFDGGEQAAAGFEVYVDLNNDGAPGTGEPRVLTGANGSYEFGLLTEGQYTVRLVEQPGYQPTTATSQVVNVVAQQVAAGPAFGVFPLPGTISGLNWHDRNGDGVFDKEESPLEGWRAFLDTNFDGVWQPGEISTFTNAAGRFTFAGIPAGSYAVTIEERPDWEQTFRGRLDAQVTALAAESGRGVAPFAAALAEARTLAADFGDRLGDVAAEATSWVVGGAALSSLGRSARALGAVVRPTTLLPDTYVVSFKSATKFDPSAWGVNVEFFYPLTARQQSTRAVPNDPQFGSQWHLRNTGQSGGVVGADANVVDVWDTYTGAGVVIGIVDDGLQRDHPDLAANYVSAYSYDFNNNDPDPRPESTFDYHGTAVAGVAAARGNNGIGVSGSAPEAGLAGLRLISAPSSDLQEANALTYFNNNVDIYSNSWGPFDNGTMDAAGPLAMAALEQTATQGRNGLGGIITWAAGNGLGSNDNVNYDGYANSRHVIAVGAINNQGRQSNYSEPGAPMLVTAYSSGGAGSGRPGITTTDVFNTYTSSFGGTSSATPLASGVIALMLEANPNLTSRDVKHVLVHSAEKNDPTDAGWETNGAGLLVNHKYGFGAVDALAAVTLAETWQTVGPELSAQAESGQLNLAIPNASSTGIERTVTIDQNVRIEHVELEIDITHADRGHLRVELVSPSGKVSVMREANSDTGTMTRWTFSSVHHWDEFSAGEWTVRVSDAVGGASGTLNDFTVRVFGTQASTRSAFVQVGLGQTVDDVAFGQQAMVATPEVLELDFAFETQQAVTLTVANAVDVTAQPVQLLNLTTGEAFEGELDVTGQAGLVTYAGGLLPDGNYRLTLPFDAVTSSAGQPLDASRTLDFFVLAGDANRDRTVDLADFNLLATNFGSAGTFSEGDFDYSGTVDLADFNALAINFGKTLQAYVDPNTLASAVSLQAVTTPAFGNAAAAGRAREVFSTRPIRPNLTSARPASDVLGGERVESGGMKKSNPFSRSERISRVDAIERRTAVARKLA